MGKVKETTAPSRKKRDEETQPSAVISYNLSDPVFITKKWTKLPRLAQQPAIGQKTKPWACFKKRDEEKLLYYPKGQIAAKFEKDGTGKVFYINGATAIELCQSILGHQRVILYREMEQPDGEPTLLGWLDSFGNCILGDSEGNIIANYSQLGGYVLLKDEFLKWRWDQFVSKRRLENNTSNEIISAKRKRSHESLGKNTSQKLLELHIKKAYDKGTLKLQEGKLYFKCKVSDCLSLWIFTQEKIDLSFASNSFITRLDVGITIQHDDGSHGKLSKHQVI